MEPARPTEADYVLTKRALEASIRIAIVFILVVWCGLIVAPFLMPILWGIIIAVGVQPLYQPFEKALGGRRKLASTLFTVIALAILLVPTVLLIASSADALLELAHGLRDGTVTVPPPNERVADWPLIGSKTYEAWSAASVNLQAALAEYQPQVEAIGHMLVSLAKGAGGEMLLFTFSLIIAGVFLVVADPCLRFLRRLGVRLVGDQGDRLSDLAGETITTVVQGVLGVAAIQGLAAGVVFLIFGVPMAGLWALLVLVLAVVQLPPALICIPAAIHQFSVADPLPATIFLILMIAVVASEWVLKPILLGRGARVPMPVVLIGAIGGMIAFGVVGLFVGAVVLAVGYMLFTTWLDEGATEAPADDGEAAEPTAAATADAPTESPAA